MVVSDRRPNLWLSLGANLGDAAGTIYQALRRIDSLKGTSLIDVSPLYRSSPVGYTDQPPFLNLAASVSTELSPEDFSAATKSIENELGRQIRPQWHEREIDIDLLLYDGISRSTGELELPHPRMLERPFVIYPLADIAPDLVHPGTGEKISAVRERLQPGSDEWIEVVEGSDHHQLAGRDEE